MISHEFQCRRKIMKNWWFLMYLSIPNRNTRFRVFSRTEFSKFLQIQWNPLSLLSVTPSSPVQWYDYKHILDFANRFLHPEWVYGQTLLGYDQSGNDFKNYTVNMTVNGFLDIQKFKFRKTINVTTEARSWWIFSIWILQTVRGDA